MLLTIIAALTPIACVIALGHALRRINFVPEQYWDAADKLVFWVFIPALVVKSVSTAALQAGPATGIGLAVLAGPLAVGLGLWAARPLLAKYKKLDGPSFTSMLQASMRTNMFIGLAIAQDRFGPESIALFAIGIAWMVPTVNVISVFALLRHGEGAKGSGIPTIFKALLRNPLILSILAGLALNFTGLGSPPILNEVLTMFGAVAVPLALLSVGASLDLKRLRRPGWRMSTATVLKLIISPTITWAAGLALGMDRDTIAIAVLVQCWPTAVSAYALARQMGGNAPLLAEIMSFQTLAAAVTAPIILALFVL